MSPKALDGATSFGLLVLRVVTGVALARHGWPKIQNPLGWMDAAGMAEPAPAALQALAALAEVCGGGALALGLLTPLAALGALCTMGYAVWFHYGRGDPWISARGASYELALVYAAATLLLLLAGPGKVSADALLFGKRSQ